MPLDVQLPRKLEPWLDTSTGHLRPSRFKALYGGRGGAKSHFFAEQLILRCWRHPTRAVCIREVQKSIRDSVRQLLIDKITKYGLGEYFQVLETEIRGRNGSLIIFVGMQAYNAVNIKSLEGYDIAWVEEAQTLSPFSLQILRPTLRREQSELWFSWNPRNKTDAVDKFFRKNPPPNAMVVQLNWRDNPWFPQVLAEERATDYRNDPDQADHIWEGAYGAGVGAILARWVHAADRQGRISDEVDFDAGGAPVEVSCDLGFRDTACFWFWQRQLGGFCVYDYDHDHGLDADDWIDRIRARLGERPLGRIWLPHDARAKTFQSKHTTAEKFLRAFPGKIGALPLTKKSDQISAARTVIGRTEFHRTRCEDGLDGLMAWEYEWNEDDQVFSREPAHNWASHRGDSYSYGCQVMQGIKEAAAPEPARALEVGEGNTMTMNDAWETRRTGRDY